VRCVVCGCDESHACRPGCLWVTTRPSPVCSACVGFLMNIRNPQRFAELLKLVGLRPDGEIAAAVKRERRARTAPP
jgi:hypothetical protein